MVMIETNTALWTQQKSQIQARLEKLFTMTPPIDRSEVNKVCEELVFTVPMMDLLAIAYFGLQTLSDDAMAAILDRLDEEVPE